MTDDIILRPLERADSDAIIQLAAESPDTGAITFKPAYKANVVDVYAMRRNNAQGVVAEIGGKAVGLGMVGFDDLQIEDVVHPTAYFFSLVVHPGYRRKGIAARLAEWRLNHAREKLGMDAVIYAHIQSGNTGSVRTAEHWSNQFIEGMTNTPVKPLTRAPRADSRYVVRQADANDAEQIASKLNAFYADYNFYPRSSGESLNAWQAEQFQGRGINQYWIVADKSGNVLAGVGIAPQADFMEVVVERVPLPIRIANLALRIVPADGVMRQIETKKAWFLPSHVDAARYLWNNVRYECRTLGNTVFVSVDSRSSLTDMFAIPRWMPKAHLGMAIYAPFKISTERPVYGGV